MPDYAAMYKRLFQSQTKAIEILQNAQQDTEEMYISAPEPTITVLERIEPDGDKPDNRGILPSSPGARYLNLSIRPSTAMCLS